MNIEPGYTYSQASSSFAQSLGKSSISSPLLDFTRNVTLTGTLTPLPSESCQFVTLINSTNNIVSASLLFSTSSIFIPSNIKYTFNNCNNTNLILVAGSGNLSYIVSK